MRKLKTQLSFPGLTFQVILPRSSWPNDFGERFLGAFSPAPSRADYLAIDAGYQLFKGFLQGDAECVVNGTTFFRSQCHSMVNVIKDYANLYVLSFESAVPFAALDRV